MGYNDVIVCVTVIKSDERVLFHQTGSISSDKSDRSDCWIMNAAVDKKSKPKLTVDLFNAN